MAHWIPERLKWYPNRVLAQHAMRNSDNVYLGATCLPLYVVGRLCRLKIENAAGHSRRTTLKKNYGTHVINLDIALKTYPLGQHLFISASNNMFYHHSQ
jgi:hypothetical protein